MNMDIEEFLAKLRNEYGLEAYTFKRNDNIGITIEGPEAVIKEKLYPAVMEMIKDKLLSGVFR